MSKQYLITCDMCGLVIKPEDHATVRVILKYGLKPTGRPTAAQERTYDCHKKCLTDAGVPIPVGDTVELKETS